jgi:hypothetical protein
VLFGIDNLEVDGKSPFSNCEYWLVQVCQYEDSFQSFAIIPTNHPYLKQVSIVTKKQLGEGFLSKQKFYCNSCWLRMRVLTVDQSSIERLSLQLLHCGPVCEFYLRFAFQICKK